MINIIDQPIIQTTNTGINQQPYQKNNITFDQTTNKPT